MIIPQYQNGIGTSQHLTFEPTTIVSYWTFK